MRPRASCALRDRARASPAPPPAQSHVHTRVGKHKRWLARAPTTRSMPQGQGSPIRKPSARAADQCLLARRGFGGSQSRPRFKRVTRLAAATLLDDDDGFVVRPAGVEQRRTTTIGHPVCGWAVLIACESPENSQHGEAPFSSQSVNQSVTYYSPRKQSFEGSTTHARVCQEGASSARQQTIDVMMPLLAPPPKAERFCSRARNRQTSDFRSVENDEGGFSSVRRSRSRVSKGTAQSINFIRISPTRIHKHQQTETDPIDRSIDAEAASAEPQRAAPPNFIRPTIIISILIPSSQGTTTQSVSHSVNAPTC